YDDGGDSQHFLHLSNAIYNVCLVFRTGDPVGNGRKLPAILRGVLRRTQVEPQLVDLTGELERTIVAILDHRDTGARVRANVEVLILRELDRGRVFHRLLGCRLPVHEQLTRTTFTEAGAGVLELEPNGVFSRLEF